MSLTIGKLRGLQEISNRAGIISILAEDHRGSMQRMANRENPSSVTPQMLTEYKLDIARAMADQATGLLLDPEYGAGAAVASGVLAGDTGLLVSLEESGYESSGDKRRQTLIEGWSAAKVKRMGASGAKLLIHYRSDLGPIAEQQEALVQQVARECQELDLALLVEPVSYQLTTESREEFAAKPGLVAEAANRISRLGIDVLKAEFPAAHNNYERAQLAEFCRAVDQACATPWVILSAGVTFDEFEHQIEIACAGGASGFAVGRAIWQEAMKISDREGRLAFLRDVARPRLQRLNEIANRNGTPWFRKLKLEEGAYATAGEGWYRGY